MTLSQLAEKPLALCSETIYRCTAQCVTVVLKGFQQNKQPWHSLLINNT